MHTASGYQIITSESDRYHGCPFVSCLSTSHKTTIRVAVRLWVWKLSLRVSRVKFDSEETVASVSTVDWCTQRRLPNLKVDFISAAAYPPQAVTVPWPDPSGISLQSGEWQLGISGGGLQVAVSVDQLEGPGPSPSHYELVVQTSMFTRRPAAT